MIESIVLENFYCFNKRTEVQFVAGRERSRAMDEMYSGYNEQNRVNLLKMVYLYGNNGAGKSKLLMAFDTLKELVTELRDDKTDPLPYHPFALDPTGSHHNPSHTSTAAATATRSSGTNAPSPRRTSTCCAPPPRQD